MRRWMILATAMAGGAASAQLLPSLPDLPVRVPGTGAIAQGLDTTTSIAAGMLDRVRRTMIARLVREHPDAIAIDPQGFAARAGEIVIDAPDEALIDAARARGYEIIERGEILGVGYARLRTPAGRSLRAAIGELRTLGAIDASADQLHFASMRSAPSGRFVRRRMVASSAC